MSHTTIHIFNPETDLALGANRKIYTPPAKIVKFASQFALLPALIAHPGDKIILRQNCKDPEKLPFYNIAKEKKLDLLSVNDIEDFISGLNLTDAIRLQPWGWNLALKKYLFNHHVPTSLLPTDDYLNRVRDLAHRRLAVEFHSAYSERFPGIETPRLMEDPDEAVEICRQIGSCCLKLPWSSSGRGIAFTELMSPRLIREWCYGAIRSQGVVILEKAYLKSLDCASEWQIEDSGNIRFLGHSLFHTSGRGIYQYNSILPEVRIRDIIATHTSPSVEYLEYQEEFIRKRIAPYYKGFLGIDMLVSDDGILNPCLEINLRLTMGHIALALQKEIESHTRLSPLVRNLCRNNKFSLSNLI